MIGFGLLCGHMLGDYILQNDWMAKNKSNHHPGPEVSPPCTWDSIAAKNTDRALANQKWHADHKAWLIGNLACTIHCLLYTLAVWACSFWWMPWWGLAACFLTHWPIDRFRLAGRWMRNVSGQSNFAALKIDYFPPGVVLVDNTFHLVTLFIIAMVALS